ncbi:MAG: hypothetical protein ABI411_06190 [Tahibacter sp.]
MRLLWLALSFVPYAALAGYDGWLHEKARVVPRVEKILHAGLALSLIAFLVLVVRGQTTAALIVLGAFLIFLMTDEFGYHAPLARHEKHIHWLADAALASFVLCWLWIDGVLA